MQSLWLTLDGVQGPNWYELIWTHLKQIESLSLAIACILVLQIMSSTFELYFSLVWTNWFFLQNGAT